MTDYERGVEQASAIYKEVIREYVAENVKLREFATLAWQVLTRNEPLFVWQGMVDDARELRIEAER